MLKDVAIALYLVKVIILFTGFLAAFNIFDFNIMGCLFAYLACHNFSELFMASHLNNVIDSNKNG